MLKRIVLSVAVLSSIVFLANAQDKSRHRDGVDRTHIYSIDSVTRGGIKLVFASNDAVFDPKEKEQMVETFYKVYPEECRLYNPDSRKDVTIFIDTAYKGVAETGGGLMRVNPEWMRHNPEDIDVVTHEAMHVVQAYPRYGPIWVTEGIADYVRATVGVNNKAANWMLPAYNSTQNYTNSYRITARFFLWLEQKVQHCIVKKLDNAMRSNTYTDAFWHMVTGKTVDELWDAYGKNPTL